MFINVSIIHMKNIKKYIRFICISINMPKRKKLSEEEKEEIFREVEREGYVEEAEVTIGENRGQFFIRIPQFAKERLSLNKKDKILFRVKENNKIELEVIRFA